MSAPIPIEKRIGLSPAPWADDDWPTYGYDGPIAETDWSLDDPRSIVERTGHTREEWLRLADVMIARWTAWKQHVESIPEHPAHAPTSEE